MSDSDTPPPDVTAATGLSEEDSQLKIRIPNPRVYMAQWKGQRGKPRCDFCRESNLKVCLAVVFGPPVIHHFLHRSVIACFQSATIALTASGRNADIPPYPPLHIVGYQGMSWSHMAMYGAHVISDVTDVEWR
jgi:hypothetical protein